MKPPSEDSMIIPALLVFSSHTEFPSQEALSELRSFFVESHLLSSLRDVVKDLQRFWKSLTIFDPSLNGISVTSAKYLGDLQHWLEFGGAFPHHHHDAPNVYSFAVTVILQVTQYFHYLHQCGSEDGHRLVLQRVQNAGIQGFCIGFLSAIAVASSTDKTEIAVTAGSCLRLAVCIGAYVDHDGMYAERPDPTACISIRWKDDASEMKQTVLNLIKSVPDAYVSSFTDATCLSATVRKADLHELSQKLEACGVRIKPVHLNGRLHSAVHSSAVEKIMEFSLRSGDLLFPTVNKLQTPLLSAVTGELITQGSLLRLALENTLLKPAHWYRTLEVSIRQVMDPEGIVTFAGFCNDIPLSLIQSSGLQVVSIGSLTGLESKTSPSFLKPNIPTNTVPFHSTHNPTTTRLTQEQTLPPGFPAHSIAIVGMAGRFPGADSLDELWELVLSGVSTVEHAPTDRLGLSKLDPTKKWWGNFLRDSDAFDHKFFKKSSREALAWDPQQRVLLEVIYEALESSGYFGVTSKLEPEDYGCYIGAVMNNYYDNLSCSAPTAYATVGTSRCYLSGLMSHYFGWTGPSLTIDTACSSSLVAINSACRAIWSGECSRAVAGGTNVITSPFDYQNLNAAGFLSPSGQCKPFDADADGYCRGEGVCAVVLKPLSTAIEDGDNVLGVIVGSGTSQNPNSSHITVPNSGAQSKLYHQVMSMAGVQPSEISYVEAHGTGTGVGDPVEYRSIRDVFGGPSRDNLLHFSSIKGNIGHTEATAGIAGLVKVLLMMQHGTIPPQASHNRMNPNIPSLENDCMEIPRSVMPWNSPSRIACVNSYGAAGSISALMVRQMPAQDTEIYHSRNAATRLCKYPLLIPAASAASLASYCKKLLSWLKHTESSTTTKVSVADLAFNLSRRANHTLKRHFSTNVTDLCDLKQKLAAAVSGKGVVAVPSPNPIVLVFAGQESDFIGLSENVYKSSVLFSQHLDTCNEILRALGHNGLYPTIFLKEPIRDLVTLHASLFSAQYSSAKSWIDSGLQVSAVLGHSFGQLTALCISGVLSLSDALKLVTGRASLMRTHWGTESGSMLYIQANRLDVTEILDLFKASSNGDYVEIACYNGPMNHVVVGSANAIRDLDRFIQRSPSVPYSVRTKRLQTTHGFHSMLTEPLLPHLTAFAKELTWNQPTIHLETCDESESDIQPDYHLVSRHTRGPVFFQRAVERLAKRFSQATWLEAGQGSSVTRLVRDSVEDSGRNIFLSPQLTSLNAHDSLTEVTIELWKTGHAVQFWLFHKSQKVQYQFLSLPPYQFEKTKHWLQFTGRNSRKETESVQIQERPAAHEFLSFMRFTDNNKKNAVFRIDPQSDRYSSLLHGHVMSGQPLAPASMYFEVVARAALHLQADTEGRTFVPTVEDLHMLSPLGKDTTKEILLYMNYVDDPNPSWTWSMTTRPFPEAIGRRSEPFEQATGTVRLQRRDDSRQARKFKRFESLCGHLRIEEIMNHPDAETMTGKHVYRAFNQIVQYSTDFSGIKSVACVGMEAAGRVSIQPNGNDPPDQRLTHTPMTDSFMQFAGFLVNYFNNPSFDDLLVCSKIEHIQMGGNFRPDAKDWMVYSNMTEDGDGHVTADAYVFEAESKRMVFAAFGFQFSKMPKTLLAKLLKRVNQINTPTDIAATLDVDDVKQPVRPRPLIKIPQVLKSACKGSTSKKAELLQILHNVTDIPVENLSDDATLDDLGVDSLGATEVLNDIRTNLGLTIDLSTFLFFPNLRAIVAHVDQKLGLGESDSDFGQIDTPSTDQEVLAWISDPDSVHHPSIPVTQSKFTDTQDRPTITSAYDAFEAIRFGYDQLASDTHAANFWTEVYPDQARLVRAYVVEAFKVLGCDLETLHHGDYVPQVLSLPRHKQLVSQLCRVLEDGYLITATNDSFVRTNVPVDSSSAEELYREILPKWPQHANVHELVKAVGQDLAACLNGDKDGLQVVFGDKRNKTILEDVYANWPLLRTPSILLGDFLTNAFKKASGGSKFRILEIGAGTGGTTRYIVNHLRSHGIPFEYTFTDISSSLVAAAKKTFKDVEEMSFEVLDIESLPTREHESAFHTVIATNCIHATRRLDVSLANIRRMLRDDGALTLIEITKNMFWLDIVVGLFDGWWLFEDGRTHALVDEVHWERVLKEAGFKEVLWTDGDSPESKSVRVIGAFPSAPATTQVSITDNKRVTTAVVDTVVYKKFDDLEIHADVYCPISRNSTEKRLPIALMIHGGSHMLFSRKDIRPAQTRLLLDMGFLPVSLDHRLCPEVSLSEGPMVDVCDALDWARHKLPSLILKQADIRPDGDRVVVVGWSSGGQLAMSLAWTAPQRGLRPPEAILAFYCPTDYEDEWWQKPIQPIGAEDTGLQYDVLEAVRDEPITNYDPVGAWEPLSDPRIRIDPRCRIVLHINWKAQTLPVIINGLPSKNKATDPGVKDWNALPQPTLDQIIPVNPRAQIVRGNYKTPTFLIHGTSDDLIPWQQSQSTLCALKDQGVVADLALVQGAPHICDLSSNPKSEGWKAVLRGYEFLALHAR